MTDADEFRVRGEAGEVGFDAIGAQVDPADNALHVRMLVRETEEPVGLTDDLTGLDSD